MARRRGRGTANKTTRERKTGTPAQALSGVSLGNALMYLGACRRILTGALGRASFDDGEKGLAFAGDVIIGLVALEMSVSAVRLLAANDPVAKTEIGSETEEQLGIFWAKVRPLRNALVYFDDRIQSSTAPSITIDLRGLRAANGPEVTFEEWIGWLDRLEPAVWRVMAYKTMHRSRPSASGWQPPKHFDLPDIPAHDPEAAGLPSQGAIWFRRSLRDGEPNAPVERGTVFTSADHVFMTARYRRIAAGEVRLELTHPDERTETVGTWTAPVGDGVVTKELMDLVAPGAYAVKLLNEQGRVLAIGGFWIDLPKDD